MARQLSPLQARLTPADVEEILDLAVVARKHRPRTRHIPFEWRGERLYAYETVFAVRVDDDRGRAVAMRYHQS